MTRRSCRIRLAHPWSSAAPRDRALWQLYARWYDGLLSFWPYRDLVDRVVARASPEAGEVVLDLGCGTGNVAIALLRSAAVSIHGVDASSKMISVAARKLGNEPRSNQVALVVSDAHAYLAGVADGSFDKIVSVNFLYVIADQTALWNEMFRCLKPNGRVVIATPIRSGSSGLIREHRAHASVRQLLRPKLVGVALVDLAIDAVARRGRFELQGATPVLAAADAAGAEIDDIVSCYGDVDILFTARRACQSQRNDLGV